MTHWLGKLIPANQMSTWIVVQSRRSAACRTRARAPAVDAVHPSVALHFLRFLATGAPRRRATHPCPAHHAGGVCRLYFDKAMDQYRRVNVPKVSDTIEENEIRITQAGKIRKYISYATSLFNVRPVARRCSHPCRG